MLEFKKYDLETLKTLRPYFEGEHIINSNHTIGCKIMWKDYFSSEYSELNNTITFKEVYENGHYSFYYPMGRNVYGMICELKDYVLENLTQELEFCCVDESNLKDLIKRFPHYYTYYNRNWSDYVYLNENFKTFAGGDYSNKRHHVKQFLKLYPTATFRKGVAEDKDNLIAFVKKFEETKEIKSEEQSYELKSTIEVIKHFDEFNFDAFIVEFNGEIIAFSICELLNDCIYDHIEKALRTYQSVYPFLVNKIANYYSNVTYFNREEDVGDPGLRFSKEDYHPIKMATANMFYVKNNLDLLCSIPSIKVDDELTLGNLTTSDKDNYFRLNTDDELNKFWGYDYHSDLKDKPLTSDYFYEMAEDDFLKKECLSFILRKNNKLIGEFTLQNLNNENEAELGFRLFKEEQGKGYAFKAGSSLIDYLKNKLKLKKLNAKAYKENIPSISLLNKLNFSEKSRDETFVYFELTLN